MENNYVLKAKEIANECSKDFDLIVDDVEWVNEAEANVLRILVDSDNDIDIEDLLQLSNLISEKLDKEDFINEDYLLDCSSVGAEKVLKTDDDIKKAIEKYVHIDFNDNYAINKELGVCEVEGYLKSYNDMVLVVEINLKGKIKSLEIDKNNIKIIRKAIKF